MIGSRWSKKPDSRCKSCTIRDGRVRVPIPKISHIPDFLANNRLLKLTNENVRQFRWKNFCFADIFFARFAFKSDHYPTFKLLHLEGDEKCLYLCLRIISACKYTNNLKCFKTTFRKKTNDPFHSEIRFTSMNCC